MFSSPLRRSYGPFRIPDSPQCFLRERSWPKHRRECSLRREHRKQKDRRPSRREGMQRLKFSYVPCAFAVSLWISVSSRDALADQQADEPEVTERQRPVRHQVRALPPDNDHPCQGQSHCHSPIWFSRLGAGRRPSRTADQPPVIVFFFAQ